MLTKNNITGLILAGGAGRRVDHKDKGLICLDGKPMIQRQIEWMKPQVDNIIISANRNIETYKAYGYPVLTDHLSKQNQAEQVAGKLEFNGPLFGLYQGLLHTKTTHLFVHPVDLPLLPSDTLKKILDYANQQISKGLSDNQVSVNYFLKTSQREHFLSLFIAKDLVNRLRQNLENNQLRVGRFLQENDVKGVDLGIPESSFANFNHTEDFT